MVKWEKGVAAVKGGSCRREEKTSHGTDRDKRKEIKRKRLKM